MHERNNLAIHSDPVSSWKGSEVFPVYIIRNFYWEPESSRFVETVESVHHSLLISLSSQTLPFMAGYPTVQGLTYNYDSRCIYQNEGLMMQLNRVSSEIKPILVRSLSL